jgi:hypothetical protein
MRLRVTPPLVIFFVGWSGFKGLNKVIVEDTTGYKLVYQFV